MRKIACTFFLHGLRSIFGGATVPRTCPNGKTPHLPSMTGALIDTLCGWMAPESAGGKPQNEAKNNFCSAPGLLSPLFWTKSNRFRGSRGGGKQEKFTPASPAGRRS